MNKKFFFLFSIIFSTCLFANYQCDPGNPCDPMDPCEGCKPCMPCDTTCPEMAPPPKPTACGFSAPYMNWIHCPSNLFINASFIYWEAKMDNTEYADIQCTLGNNTDFATNNKTNTIQNVKFNYEPGFKIGLGLNFICDNWDLYAEYTYFRSSASNNSSISNEELNTDTREGRLNKHLNIYFPSNPLNTSSILGLNENYFPTFASAKWDIDLDSGYIQLSREGYFGKCLTIDFLSGIQLTWISQKYTSFYSGPVGTSHSNAQNNPSGSFTYQMINSVKSWGLGPRFGINSSWQLCNGFRLFSDFSLSILYTDYYTQEQNILYQLFENPGNTLSEEKTDLVQPGSDYCALRPQNDLTIGIAWGNPLNCNRWFFDLQIGYYFSTYWNQNMFYKELDSARVRNNNASDDPGTVMDKHNQSWYTLGGDLFIHGLTVTAKLEF